MSGSSSPSRASAVRSRPTRSRIGVPAGAAGSQSSHIHAQVAQDAQRDALGFILQDGGQQVAFFDLGGAFRLRQLLGPLQVLRGAGGQLRLGAGSGLALSERGAQPVADALGVVTLAAQCGRGVAVQLRQRDEEMGRTHDGRILLLGLGGRRSVPPAQLGQKSRPRCNLTQRSDANLPATETVFLSERLYCHPRLAKNSRAGSKPSC